MRDCRNIVAVILLVIATGLARAGETPTPLWLSDNCADCPARMATQTGVYILEKGEESLIGRAWLAGNAEKTIDIQYFIWSSDNIGTLAAQNLLRAAERGVRVRVLVDDLLVDVDDKILMLLAAHPNVHIRIYNPNLTVGVNFWQRMGNALTKFRSVNQRMHDKTAIFDGVAGITGGRNMADEYFDFNHEYNFRDRDVLLLGPAVVAMTENFEDFWNSEYAHPVEAIFADKKISISPAEVKERARVLHAYAADPRNFERAIRLAIVSAPRHFPEILKAMQWDDVAFISDQPGKNTGEAGLGGGGRSTEQLIEAVKSARSSILIQSPYLVMPDGGIELFGGLVERGIRVRISTNSLASTDNIQAFSGYAGQRKKLLEAGIELYEYKPYPAIRNELIERYPRIAENNPIFAIHAKSMVIDDETVFIGTFNLDPRSANLNTEVGMLASNRELAAELTASIEKDIHPDNSWRITRDFNPDGEVTRGKRLRLWFNRMLPLEPVL
ncbi:MAG: phospholipase D family protein [Woeseiaceae bacterium]|nr:phospholipase D family protein [Woeseiaceae bacterium]